MKKESILRDKSYAFAIKIVEICRFLYGNKEFILSKQLMKIGTAVGVMTMEAEYAQSRADFVNNKLYVALKEANETAYWLQLLKDTNYIDVQMYENIHTDCNELISMLAASVKTAKKNILSS